MSNSRSGVSQSSKNFSASSIASLRDYNIKELYDEDCADVLMVDKHLLDPRGVISKYKFTHKSIWCAELIQSNPISNLLSFVGRTVAGTSNLEHWAFVARGTIPGMDDMVAYFVAQFGGDDYIPTVEELPNNPKNFHALLIESDKRMAALQVCSTKERSAVWVKPGVVEPNAPRLILGPVPALVDAASTALATDILTHPGGKLKSRGFVPKNWTTMRAKSLKELNDEMFKSRSAGKSYDLTNNNCQHFAYDLFKRVV